ncbi:PREDICTED: glutamate-rich protein 3 isoform X2 [Chinchilla lanigera]|nr:PREDICTED: glutamate-rich protein 3 isoform X2 [Chinchilla lanigera]
MRKFRNSTEKSQKVNLYQFPSIDTCRIPIPPPPPPPNGKLVRESKSEMWRRRRLRPTTAPNGLEPLFTKDSGRIYKTSVHSNAAITMIYLGKNVHLAYDDPDFRDEIRVYQQHCGGENLCVYKGKLLEKETFQFISKRHHGFPFSLTFYLNGMQVNRLSSCCEYKHRKGSRLGGKRGYFGFVCVERASPCYKCIIAMGLDKKTSPLKPRKEKSPEDREDLRKEEEKLRKTRENWIPIGTETENKISTSATFLVEEIKPEVREVKTAVEEMELKGKLEQDVWDENQEYEEDFEVDDEKQDEKANEEGQADDQMNGISKSPSEDEKDNLGPGKESTVSSQKAADTDDSEKDEGDGYSESELEEDRQDTRSASSVSSGSHPYSSDSEDDSAERDREALADRSTDKGARSSSSLQLSENDEPRKSHLPFEESFETELEDQEVRKADVGETKPLPTEESGGNILEEEMERRTQETAENSSEESRKHVFEKEKAKDKSQLWEGSTAKVEDKQAGLPGVEEGAPNRNLVVEERAEFNSNKESKQITQETRTLEKEAAEAGEGPQHQDTDLMEDKGGAAQEEEAGANEFPSGEWEPTAEQPALAQQFPEAREIPVDLASGVEADEEEDGRLGREELDLTVSLCGGEAPEEQALRQTGKAASSAEEQNSAKTVFPAGTAQSSQHPQEEVTLRDATTSEMGEAEKEKAVSQTGFERPAVDGSEEEAPTDLEDSRPGEDAESLKEDRVEEATLGGEEPDKEGTEVLQAETPLSSSTAEAKAERSGMGASGGSPEKLPEETTLGKEMVTELAPNRKDDREEMSREQLDVPRERRKAERLVTSLREPGSERKVVTWADELKDEDTLEEEQKLKEEEKKTTKEIRSEEQAKAPRNGKESGAEDEESTEATDLTEGTELLEDSPGERVVNLLEVTSEFEKSPEKVTAVRKEGEGLREGRDTEHEDWAEGQGQDTTAPSKQGEGPGRGGEGTSEGPGSEPLGEEKVPDLAFPDAGQAEECAVLDHGGPTGLAGRDGEKPQQGPGGTQAMRVTQEPLPERDPRMAKKFSEEAEGEEPEEERDQETGVMEDSNTERDGVTGGASVMAEEERVAGTAAERKEVLADLKTFEGKTVANTAASSSDVAVEETRLKGDEAPGKTAAEERVVAEEMALSRGVVTAACTTEAGGEVLPEPSKGAGEPQRLGQDGEEGEAEAAQPTGSAQAKAGPGVGDPGQVTGAAEESPQERESEPSRGSLEVVAELPVKPDFSGTQEEQEHTVQRQSESVDVP